MIGVRDPDAMTAEERLRDIASLLSTAYLRHLAKGHISSGEPSALPEVMAPCVETVNGGEIPPGKDQP